MSLVRIQKGQVIRASYLRQFEDVAEAFGNPRLRRPVQTGKPNEAEQINTRTGSTWAEIERLEETVRVENPDDAEQYVDVARMRTVTLRNEQGDTMQLVFNNLD